MRSLREIIKAQKKYGKAGRRGFYGTMLALAGGAMDFLSGWDRDWATGDHVMVPLFTEYARLPTPAWYAVAILTGAAAVGLAYFGGKLAGWASGYGDENSRMNEYRLAREEESRLERALADDELESAKLAKWSVFNYKAVSKLSVPFFYGGLTGIIASDMVMTTSWHATELADTLHIGNYGQVWNTAFFCVRFPSLLFVAAGAFSKGAKEGVESARALFSKLASKAAGGASREREFLRAVGVRKDTIDGSV